MSAPNKSAMLQLPKEKKWQIYCSQRLVQQQQEMGCLKSNGGGIVGIQETRAASDGNISDPEFYIEKIKALAMVRIFQSLSFGCCFFWGKFRYVYVVFTPVRLSISSRAVRAFAVWGERRKTDFF